MRMVRLLALRAGLRQSMRGVSGLRFSGTGLQLFGLHQYYYVNQGPTYSGPGNFAPYPTYQESALGWDGYRRHRRPHVLRRYY